MKKFVREYVTHQRDDLHDVRIRMAGVTYGFQIGVAYLAAGLDDFARELEGGVPLRPYASIGGVAYERT